MSDRTVTPEESSNRPDDATAGPALWIATVHVRDEQQYLEYVQRGAEAVKRYGGTVIAKSTQPALMEGSSELSRTVVIRFPTFRNAVECYRSAEYQAARALRSDAATSEIRIVPLLQD